MTVRRIAKEIEVSERALYRHFKSKTDILFLMVERIEEDLVKDIEMGSRSGGTPLEVLDASLRSHVSSIQQRRGVAFQVMAEIISFGDKKLSRRASRALDSDTARIRDILSAGIDVGQIRSEIDLDKAAILVAAALQGLVSRWALSSCDFNLEEQYESIWAIQREAIVAPQGTGQLRIHRGDASRSSLHDAGLTSPDNCSGSWGDSGVPTKLPHDLRGPKVNRPATPIL